MLGIIIGYLLAFILGALCMPILIFLRARKCDQWDNSNMTNIYRIVAHLAAHPDDFGKMQYKDGKKPFWYISKDELSDVVNTRPNPEKPHNDSPDPSKDIKSDGIEEADAE